MPPELDTSQDVANKPSSKGRIARSLMRFSRNAANVSLPGFAELGDTVKELVEDWKIADHNDEEIAWLATRLEDLCSLIREFDAAEHPDVSDASRKFHELKDSLAERLKCRPRSGIHGAEQQQHWLDNLNREIGQVVEMTLLRLALVQAQSNKRGPMDNFQVISAHEITDQTLVHEETHQTSLTALNGHESWPLPPDRSVVVSIRQGRLGKVPVMYKTFYSPSDNGAAAKVAEAELKYLSRCLHPNITSTIGITKGYDGLNGYLVSANGIPLIQFLSQVDSGTILSRFIGGMKPDHVTVNPNGHLTAFPTLEADSLEFGLSLCLDWLGDGGHLIPNPATRAVLTMFSDNFNNMRVYSPSDQTLTGGIFDSIEALDQRTFTVLEIARLAVKYKMLPSRHYHFWHMAAAPPYTVGLGDFGYIVDQNPKAVWNPIALKQAADVELWHLTCKCGRANHGHAHREDDQWISISLHDCEHNWFRWQSQEESGRESSGFCNEWARQARAFLRNNGMRVKGSRYCSNITYMCLEINRTGSIQLPSEPLYFHCNPFMRSNPRLFWGFLNTSSDPYTPSIDPKEVGLELAYFV
ncbi:hypothetical protein FRC09_003573 [Ceratobasidium sp. 395]|nr:hypothetical protein FRC09_003573 [Ceratobasidium sp. 395]